MDENTLNMKHLPIFQNYLSYTASYFQ